VQPPPRRLARAWRYLALAYAMPQLSPLRQHPRPAKWDGPTVPHSVRSRPPSQGVPAVSQKRRQRVQTAPTSSYLYKRARVGNGSGQDSSRDADELAGGCLSGASPCSASQRMSLPIPLRAAGQPLPPPRAWDVSPGPATVIQCVSQPLERGLLASTHGQSENTPAPVVVTTYRYLGQFYRYANWFVL
jgi:hypothetical protein